MIEKNPDHLYVRALRGRADVRQFVGQAVSSLADYRTLIEFCERAGAPDRSAVPDAMLCIAYILAEEKNDFAGSKKIIGRALTMIDARRESGLYTDGVCLLGLLARRQGEYKKALRCFRDVYVRRRKAGDLKGLAMILNNFGNVYWNLGEFKKSLAYYYRALAICERLRMTKTISSVACNIGLVYSDLGDSARALRYYTKDLAISQRLGNKWGLAIAYENIGALYHDRGDTERALENHNRSLRLAEEIGYPSSVSNAMGGIGLTYYDKSEFTKAHDFLRRSLRISKLIGDTSGTGFAFEGIGRICFVKGDLRRAMAYFNRDRAIKQKLDDKNGLGVAHLNQGMCAAEFGRVEEARRLLVRAEREIRDVGNKYALIKVLASRADIETNKLRLPAAFNHAAEALNIARGLRLGAFEIITLRTMGRVYGAWSSNGGVQKMPKRFYNKTIARGKGISWAAVRAITYLKRSVSFARKMNRRIELARSLFDLGAALELTGRERAAATCRREATAIFKQTGARLWLRKIAESRWAS
jgi:tetratricopeptide (TPR) repeat protein